MARNGDDDAPWLAAAEPPVRASRASGQAGTQRAQVSQRSLFWTIVVLLTLAAVAAIALIIAFTRRESGSTAGYMNAEQAPLITAEAGPYKVPPDDPRGLDVEGQDQTLYAAGEGLDPASVIDGNSIPEDTMPRPGLPRDLVPETDDTTAPAPAAPATVAPVPIAPAATPPAAILPPPARPANPPPAKPVPAKAAATTPAATTPATIAKPPAAKPPASRAGTVQLGAFSSEDKAMTAWAALAGKPGMVGFARRIIKVESDGKTLYRLRASGGDTALLCASLKAAGQPCTVVE